MVANPDDNAPWPFRRALLLQGRLLPWLPRIVGPAQRRLSGRSVEHEQNFLRSVRHDTLHHVLYFSKLIHEPDFVVQTSGRVNNHDIRALGFSRGEGIKRHGGRIATHFCFTTGTPTRSPPPICRVALWRQHGMSAAPSTTLLPAFLYCAASLPIVVVFPTPFTPTTIITYGSPVFFDFKIIEFLLSGFGEHFR